uniref:Uncharacterized protein LOC111106150 n=1 Tax=Crassostrea virginica TaxID=6565 RepID=A0A8B8AZ58_CRAVI|nr:uncharacterized protein LOC111106150 [Crassostrea virginica]XP_022296407.1 uncharacterized protein LOC111106150 [Crassostrea virginica]
MVLFWFILSSLSSECLGQTQQIMFTHRRSCRRPHQYQSESHFLLRAIGSLPGRHCNMTFIESDWSAKLADQQCFSLCVRLVNASMNSCDFRMTYYDGIGDHNPRTFNCKSYPPSLWCSSNKDVTLEFQELDSYNDRRIGDGYDLTLEVKPYCHHPTSTVPGDAYLDHYLRKEKRDRDTIIIAGSLVSTICFLFVIFWFVYCCWKRQAPQESYQRPTTPLSHSNSFKSSGSGRKGPGTSTSSNGDRAEAKNWYPMTTRSPAKYPPPVYSSQGWDAPLDNRYTELPGTSYSPQRGTGPGYHLRQCAPREPYNPLAPIREQPPMYKLTFEVTERSHDPGMPFRGPPPLPPRPLNNPQHRPSKQYYI